MFSEVLERFIQDSPVAVMVRVLLENLLNADKMDRWFDTVRHVQYTKEILFSSIVGLMLQVVCKLRPSVHSAYLCSEIPASIVAVYDKLKGLETTTSQRLYKNNTTLSRVQTYLSHLFYQHCFFTKSPQHQPS